MPQARSDCPVLLSARSVAATCSSFCPGLLRIKRQGNIVRSPHLNVVALQTDPAQRTFAQGVFERGADELGINLSKVTSRV